MRRLVATSIVALMTAATGLVAGAPAPAAASAAAAKPRPTPFAVAAAGLGTLVKGGEVPARSGKTAFSIIGCTNLAPVTRTNHVAEATAPGLGVVSGLSTRVWTTARDGVVSSNSVHSLSRLVIKEAGLGKVVITGIRSEARAWHDGQGFHASRSSEVGKIVYTPVEGGPEVHQVPTPGETLTIPGLAKIKLGAHARRSSSERAWASATAMKIEVLPSGTTARVAYSRAHIWGGVKSGLFRGSSNATRAQGLDGNLTSGPNPFLPMPCQGTDGEEPTNNLAELNLGDQVVVSGANTQQMGDQTRRRAWGYEKASVAELNLGDGQLVIEGVVGKVNVTRRGGNVRRNARGTTIGSITADGEPKTFPETGPLEIPGLASIERRVVEKWRNGIMVTAVRITLLDGSGAVINLGQAQLRIKRSGL